MGQVGKALTRKLGPAPAYVWLGLFAVFMLVYRSRHKAAAAGTPLESSGPIVPVNIGPTRSESQQTVTLYRPPSQPIPYGTVNRKSEGAFQALITWWQGGGQGSPPDINGVKNKRDRALFAQELNYYRANPYSSGTLPNAGGSIATSETTDPTTDQTTGV